MAKNRFDKILQGLQDEAKAIRKQTEKTSVAPKGSTMDMRKPEAKQSDPIQAAMADKGYRLSGIRRGLR